MNLANEYLRVVEALLPKAQREDIAAELRDTVLSRIEEREAELGRPLTEAETEAVLHEIGHPILVAGRYREGPQHAVGPALYPYWAFVVKVAVTIQLAVAAVILVISVASGANFGEAWGRALGAAISGTAALVGFATIAAWAIERYGRPTDRLRPWRVRDLHMLEFVAWDWSDLGRRLASGHARRPRLHRRLSSVGRGLGAIAAGAVFVLWWIGVLNFGLSEGMSQLARLDVDPGRLAAVDWVEVRAAAFWPVLAYGCAIVLLGVVMVATPRAIRLVGLLDLAIGAGALAIVHWFWTASPLAPAIQVASFTELALRLRAFGGVWPAPLEPVATLVALLTALGGGVRMLRGLAEIAVGYRPRRSEDPIPASARPR